MSNLGLKTLHAVASRIDGVAVDRAFAPWPDAESRMRDKGIPLYGLSSRRPLAEFDLLGITLQSELTTTNVLTVLDLAGLPLRAADRDSGHPLVIAGGPNAVNPAVLAAFFDLFVLGDGEDALAEILATVRDLKPQGVPRAERLRELAKISGVYVPSLHDGERIAVRRLDSLAVYPEPDGLPVSLIELTQDQHSVEIMRGCTCGCRFCQAGMYYRPVRNRAVEQIARAARRGVRNGGWDTVTLLSLSSADYPAIEALVDTLLPEFESAGVSLSFPSLRVDKRTLRLLGRMGGGRRSGLTFAVEAGSQRLRDVAGKKVDEAGLLEMVETAFRAGWTMVKLYFMVGLPTETDEDLDAAARLIDAVADIGRRIGGRRNVNVTLSPFVPKPGTPFQWEAQAPPAELERRIWRIRDGVRNKRVAVKYHDPLTSTLEGILARGGPEMAAVVETAWRSGARFEGWTELFDWSLWQKALDEHGLTLEAQLAARDEAAPLPWRFVELPVSGRFLASQLERARDGKNVSDCSGGACLGCGVDEPENCRLTRALPELAGAAREATPGDEPLATGPLPTVENTPETDLWRMRYARRGLLRFIGHLDNARCLEFMLRRSRLPVVHSAGFNSRMRLHFSPALPLGVESEAEYLDFELVTLPESEVREALASASSGMAGFEILELEKLPPETNRRGLVSTIAACAWRAAVPLELAGSVAAVDKRRRELSESGGCLERRDKQDKTKQVDLSRTLAEMSVTAGRDNVVLEFGLMLQGPHSERPDRFTAWLLELDGEALARCRFIKTEAVLPLAGDRQTN
jgi:radical SAM family uncharacterized protein/radical SAM-linked protein